MGTLELGVEGAELGESLCQLTLLSGAGVDEVEGQGELRGGELGQGLDEDVGDNLVLGAVGVELVPSRGKRR